MALDKNWLGEDATFIWIGKVESRQDPLELGRVQVRMYATHSASLTDIPSADLPWAQISLPITVSPPLGVKENDVVWGFYLDGYNKQIPLLVGILPGYPSQPNNRGEGFNDLRSSSILVNAPRPTTSVIYNEDGSGVKIVSPSSAAPYPLPTQLGLPSLSGATRYDIANTVIQQRTNNLDKNVPTATGLSWSEPVPAYNSRFPYNHAYQSESGHLIEIDDTPGAERISTTHRSGSFDEMYPSGSRVQKVTKSNYSIVMGDDYIHVMGRVLITVGENAYVKVLGDTNIECDNDLNIVANGDFNLSVGGDIQINGNTLNATIKNDINLISKQSLFITAQEQLELFAKGSLDMEGSSISQQVTATAGESNNLPAPGPVGAPNTGVAGPEPTPVPPAGIQQLNAYTALAVKQSAFLITDPTTGQQTTPDANVANTPCSFDVNTRTFINDPWIMSSSGLVQLQQREGYGKELSDGSCQAYPDPVIGPSLLTIGYGTTSCVLPNKDALTPNTIISQVIASQYLNDALNNIFVPALQQYVKVQLTQNMVDALLSFMYNVGVGNFAQSTMLKYINQKNWCAAAESLRQWVYSNGVKVSGLISRRNNESQQFLR